MKGYLSFPHIMVTARSAERTIVDEQLSAAGHQRQVALRVPSCGSAVAAAQGTRLIATVPRAATLQYAREASVHLAAPPFPFEPIRILMSWHPSMDGEPALAWFRQHLQAIGRHFAKS